MAAFCISNFNHLIRFIKKKIYHKMQREKLYNLHRTANFAVVLFVVKIDKILINQILTLRKRYFFGKRRKIRFFLFRLFIIIELFTLHLVVYFFFYTTAQVIEIWNAKRGHFIWPTRYFEAFVNISFHWFISIYNDENLYYIKIIYSCQIFLPC